MTAGQLDFVVIGASKSGTTSLFQYLRNHPAIYLPASKDAPFFSSDEWYTRGWSAAAREFYGDAPDDRLWGSVTPRYLEDPRVPRRMASLMPQLKLVALLRNPVDRAYSQYRQQVRRGKEARSYAEAIGAQLEQRALQEARQATAPGESTHRYVAFGEYSRLLARFLDHFPLDQLMVLFSEDLKGHPDETFDGLLRYLEIEPGFRPANLGKTYHRGGSRERFPGLVPRLRASRPMRRLWHLIPRSRRRALWVWYFTRLNVVSDRAPEITPEIRKRLAEHYRPDVEQLERLIGRAAPWPDLGRG